MSRPADWAKWLSLYESAVSSSEIRIDQGGIAAPRVRWALVSKASTAAAVRASAKSSSATWGPNVIVSQPAAASHATSLRAAYARDQESRGVAARPQDREHRRDRRTAVAAAVADATEVRRDVRGGRRRGSDRLMLGMHGGNRRANAARVQLRDGEHAVVCERNLDDDAAIECGDGSAVRDERRGVASRALHVQFLDRIREARRRQGGELVRTR